MRVNRQGKRQPQAQESRGQEEPGQQVKLGKGGKHMNKRWNPEGEGDVQVDRLEVDGRFTPRQGGEKNQVQQREVERFRMVKDVGVVLVSPRDGGKKIQNKVEKGGAGENSNRLTVETKPRDGKLPVLSQNIVNS